MIPKSGGPSDPAGASRPGLIFDSEVRRTLVPEDGKWLEFTVSHTYDLNAPDHLAALKARFPGVIKKYNELLAGPDIRSATVWCVDVKGRKFFLIVTKDARHQQAFHAFDAQAHEFP